MTCMPGKHYPIYLDGLCAHLQGLQAPVWVAHQDSKTFDYSGGPEQAQVMEQEVLSLLIKEAIDIIPPPERNTGFYSRYFIVLKK